MPERDIELTDKRKVEIRMLFGMFTKEELRYVYFEIRDAFKKHNVPLDVEIQGTDGAHG